MADPTYAILTSKRRVRKTPSRASYGDLADEPSMQTEGGESIVAQGLPERSELVRLGRSFGASIPTGSAFTFVAAWPTTRAELLLFNRDQTRTYAVDRVWLANITSMAAAQPFSLLAQIVPASLVAAVAAVADNANVLRWNLLGKNANFDSGATFALANTAFAIANKWFPLGNAAIAPMTTNLGASIEANVYGKYLIPPGAALALAGLAGTAAGTAVLGLEWHELGLTTS